MSNITVGLGTQIILSDGHTGVTTGVEKRTVNALVLSAGGLFAAYQAGVYKALWPYWKPDVVVGVSAGALNGWLMAARVEPDELIERWLHPDAGTTIRFVQRPNLWRGYFDPVPLLDRARSLQRDFQLKLPMGVVSVEIPAFRPRMFRDAEITPEHLAASCSIPLLYPTVRVGGRRMLDGGLFEPTPVWAAAAMGATRVIAINSLPKLTPWPIHLVLSGMHRMRRMPVPEGLEVWTIKPSGFLGGAREAVVWERANVLRWVEMGIADGERFWRERVLEIEKGPQPFG